MNIENPVLTTEQAELSDASMPKNQRVMTSRAQVGDVICSEEFQYREDEENGLVRVGLCFKQQERVVENGKVSYQDFGPFIEKVDGKFDPTTKDNKYVVEWTAMDGGGAQMGHHPSDVSSPGWHVKARKLASDGSYDPRGEVIEFYQSGPYTHEVEEVELLGKMSQSFS